MEIHPESWDMEIHPKPWKIETHLTTSERILKKREQLSICVYYAVIKKYYFQNKSIGTSIRKLKLKLLKKIFPSLAGPRN